MNTKRILALLLTFFSAFLCVTSFGCGREEDEPVAVYYTVTFDYGDGSGTETFRRVEYGAEVKNLPSPSETPSGKSFTGWRTEDGRIFANGTKYSFEGNITLTAQYSAEIYTITYNVAGGGTLSGEIITSYSVSDDEIALPIPTKAGYNFSGWDNGTEIITEIAAGTTGNLTLTAVWQAKTYTITFDYNGGTGTETSRNVEYDSMISTLPTPSEPPVGKLFTSWQTEDSSFFIEGTVYSLDKNITLTANYSYEIYSITYNVAGGNTLPADAPTSYTVIDADITLPTPTKTDGVFLGWKESENSDVYITVIPSGSTGNKSFIAVWQSQFVITLNNSTAADFTAWADGTKGNKTVLVNVGDKLTIPAIKWESYNTYEKNIADYEFLGWFYKDKDNKEREFNASVALTSENLNIDVYQFTVYAKISYMWAGPY